MTICNLLMMRWLQDLAATTEASPGDRGTAWVAVEGSIGVYQAEAVDTGSAQGEPRAKWSPWRRTQLQVAGLPAAQRAKLER